MKIVAYMILTVIVSIAVLEPIAEYGLLLNEKIMTSSALYNAMEVANRTSLNYEDMRNLDAVVDRSVFLSEFSDAFEAAAGVYQSGWSSSGDTSTITFEPSDYDDPRDPITVTLVFTQLGDPATEKVTTRVNASAVTPYVFKIKGLATAASLSPAMDFNIVTERMYVMEIAN